MNKNQHALASEVPRPMRGLMLSLLIKVFRKEQAEEHSENGAVSVVPLGCNTQANRGRNHQTQAHTGNKMASLTEVVLQ